MTVEELIERLKKIAAERPLAVIHVVEAPEAKGTVAKEVVYSVWHNTVTISS